MKKKSCMNYKELEIHVLIFYILVGRSALQHSGPKVYGVKPSI
jgi:hypothetical protein